MTKKAIFFGGSFDPPHFGHLYIVDQIISHQLADLIVIVPCYSHPFDKKLTNFSDRIRMLRMLFYNKDNILISDIESKLASPSYTYNTLDHISKIYKNYKFSLLLGSDQLAFFHKWYHYQELLSEYEILVYPRSNYQYQAKYPQMKYLADFDQIDGSSTQIKKFISYNNFDKLIDYLPKKLISYIRKHHLYEK